MKDKINLKLDSPYKVKVETLEEFETSLFFETYKKAAKIVKGICETNQYQRKKKNQIEESGGRLEENTYTVLPFLGNRGTGKTSVMVSFATSFLQDYQKENLREQDIYEKLGVKGLEAKFHVLNMIDATILEAPEEIIEIVMVRMLDQLKKKEEEQITAKRRYWEEFDRDRRRLMQDFGETIEAVHNLFYKKDRTSRIDTTPMEYLRGMGISWNLKNQIRKLIEDYIKTISYLDFTEESDDYLVFMIDDIDMNVKNCYEFLEIVRCYFMMPNVIVLLSTNYEQLHQMCQNYYRKLLHYESRSSYEIRRINGLANEYLEKIIPTGRRVFLPSIRSEEETVSIEINGRNGNKLTIREEILGTIYQYTGLLYMPKGEERHFMEPKTLRKLTNYKQELSLLTPITKKTGYKVLEEKEIVQSNMDWMYYDVVNRLAFLKLEGQYLSVFQEIVQQSSISRNSILIQELLEYFDPEEEDEKFIFYLNRNEKTSYGDVLYLLEKCKSWQVEEKKLTECILALYMVFIYKQFLLIDFGRESSKKRKERPAFFAQLAGKNDMGFLTNYLFPSINISIPYLKGLTLQGEQNKSEIVDEKIIPFSAKQENSNIKDVLDIIVRKKSKDADDLHIFEAVHIFALFQPGEAGKTAVIDFLNFIPYIFEFKVYMPEVLDYYIEVMKLEKGEDDLLRKKSVYFMMKEWEEKFQTTSIIPFYSMDFMFQLSGVIHEKMQKYVGKTVLKEDAREIFIELFQIIGEELKKLDKFYTEYERKTKEEPEIMNYFEIYKENPLIKILGIYEETLSKKQERIWEMIILIFVDQTYVEGRKAVSDDFVMQN